MPKEIKLKTVATRNGASGVQLAGMNYGNNNNQGNEGVFISTEFYRNDILGKPYPGMINYITQRVLSKQSSVIRAIVSLRTQQVAMLPYSISPSDEDEPTRKVNLFDYNLYEVTYHPAFDEPEKSFLKKMYLRVDPDAYKINKQPLFESMKDEFTGAELATLTHLQEKHDRFYHRRDEDIKKIKALLNNPDPWFTETTSWSQLIKAILYDLITLDRGAILKIRDDYGRLRGLLPLDGSSLRPIINEFGFVDDDRAYVQVTERGGFPQAYLAKKDVIIMMMNPMTDMQYFGYGLSPMETLFTMALTDIYIDKGQLDFYRKGGSIPEGFLTVEPPTSRDGMISQMDQETIESMQRHLQAIMTGDYTQVPIFSGAKVTYTDFKGKRRDMQYKELAEYAARKICSVLQVSPQDVGITADVNKSSGQVQQDLTKSKGLLPLMNTISEYITRHVVEEIRTEKDLKLTFTENDPEKAKNDWTIDQQQLISGVMTINEYRVQKGRAPVPWGNVPLQGLRNWQDPAEQQQGGMPGMPPGGGGLPPMPGMMNPGGPVGGANPMAGRPPAGAIKSSHFFALKSATTEEEAEELMIRGFAEMYQESARGLEDIHNYPGSRWLRTPAESYQHFAESHPSLGILLDLPEDTDSRDVLLLSVFDGKEIVLGGNLPLIKSMATAAFHNLSPEARENIERLTRGNGLEAVEKYIYEKLDPPVHEALYKDYYRFKSFSVTDAQLEEIAEWLA